jgi:hypothetical protein
MSLDVVASGGSEGGRVLCRSRAMKSLYRKLENSERVAKTWGSEKQLGGEWARHCMTIKERGAQLPEFDFTDGRTGEESKQKRVARHAGGREALWPGVQLL